MASARSMENLLQMFIEKRLRKEEKKYVKVDEI